MARACITLQNRMLFKTYELCISGTFCLIFSDHSLLWVTKTSESRTMDKGVLCVGQMHVLQIVAVHRLS